MKEHTNGKTYDNVSCGFHSSVISSCRARIQLVAYWAVIFQFLTVRNVAAVSYISGANRLKVWNKPATIATRPPPHSYTCHRSWGTEENYTLRSRATPSSVLFIANCPHHFSIRSVDRYDEVEHRRRRRFATGTEGTPTSEKPSPIAKILDQGDHHVVVAKPPSVVCHHSEWTGSRPRSRRISYEPSTKNSSKVDFMTAEQQETDIEIPMLQRVRDTVGRRVNLVHRLDRGASGCLLFAFTEGEGACENGDSQQNPTSQLIQALASPDATKTYVALVRGEGMLHGTDLKSLGWFTIDRPIRDEKGNFNDATTEFRFLSGHSSEAYNHTSETNHALDGSVPLLPNPRASLVLARPHTGRWHQIRRHLNGLSHPILGDSSHGSSKLNREWREKRNMPGERTCLHLARIKLPPTTITTEQSTKISDVLPHGLDVSCPIPKDMYNMMAVYLPCILEEALPLLKEEGIVFESHKD